VKFYNKTLNKKFWSEDNKFNPDIREKLLSITNDFIDKLDLDGVEIYDVTLTGSNSNYNYNDYSDLDVHVLIDFKDINEDEDLVKKALDGQRFVWNLRHNISLRDHGVEMYMQDKDEPHVASGLYSLLNDEWITEPSYDPPTIDERDVYKKAKTIEDDVRVLKERVLDVKGRSAKDLHDCANQLKKKISNMRKSGLEREGEFSIENLAFKVLRNTEVIGDLIDIISRSYDKIYMENFKTFFEYYQGEELLNPHMRTGKNINRVGLAKKHLNTVPKQYSHECPHVRNLLNGGAHQIKLMGAPLHDTLNVYQVDYAPGISKSLGNSGVEVEMFEDEEGNHCGMLKRKN
jgi:hypothetical protein|tara:strand:- start:791 stop:1828 length:1038 start_codon:yes stop_codon:yes gene_type:complete